LTQSDCGKDDEDRKRDEAINGGKATAAATQPTTIAAADNAIRLPVLEGNRSMWITVLTLHLQNRQV